MKHRGDIVGTADSINEKKWRTMQISRGGETFIDHSCLEFFGRRFCVLMLILKGHKSKELLLDFGGKTIANSLHDQELILRVTMPRNGEKEGHSLVEVSAPRCIEVLSALSQHQFRRNPNFSLFLGNTFQEIFKTLTNCPCMFHVVVNIRDH